MIAVLKLSLVYIRSIAAINDSLEIKKLDVSHVRVASIYLNVAGRQVEGRAVECTSSAYLL